MREERRERLSENMEMVTPGEWPGMTLRDYFAAKALNGMLSNGFMPEMALPAAGGMGAKWNYVGAAYFLADAMLAERAK